MNSQELLTETEQSEGEQGWLATFADLMSLLMCFFVLLLSFSELDVLKFKQIAGSMKYAFGVQHQIKVQDIPKGTSVIAQEFSPATPEATPINDVRQFTMEVSEPQLAQKTSDDQNEQDEVRQEADLAPELKTLQQRIATELQDELKRGSFELDNLGQQLVIRIQEQGSFASGSGFLQPRFEGVLQKLASLLVDIPGEIKVTGHTDNQRLHNELYFDNLELSTARALAVARVLRRQHSFNHLNVVGAGANLPLVSNNTPINRSKNRRVEISIHQGNASEQFLTTLEPISG